MVSAVLGVCLTPELLALRCASGNVCDATFNDGRRSGRRLRGKRSDFSQTRVWKPHHPSREERSGILNEVRRMSRHTFQVTVCSLEEEPRDTWRIRRREATMLSSASLLLGGIASGGKASAEAAVTEDAPPAEEETSKPAYKATKPQITQRVYLDFTICPSSSNEERTLGSQSIFCEDGEPIGRVIVGLYGKVVPVTVEHFLTLCTNKTGATYRGTIIHKSIPGQYLLGGQQGRKRYGQVEIPTGLSRNPELTRSEAFQLDHSRPGTLSLALSVNDDEENVTISESYRNTEFLITTGPGPVPSLDGYNVVFGTVLEGMDIISAIASVPTYLPNEKIQQFNQFASFIGDERAAMARKSWNKPLRTVVISDCGLIEPPPTPMLPPTLP